MKKNMYLRYMYGFFILTALITIPNTYEQFILGEYKFSIYSMLLGIIYLMICVRQIWRGTELDSINLLIIFPFSILILKGYQMINPFTIIIILVMIVKIGLRRKININKTIRNLFIIYGLCILSSMILIILDGENTQGAYWIGINLSIVTEIIMIVLVNEKFEFKKEEVIRVMYHLIVCITMVGVLRFFIGMYKFGVADIGGLIRYKRIFSFPTMSTSNYMIVIILIMYFYIKANMKFFKNREIAFITGIIIIAFIFSSSRTSILATIIVLCVELIFRIRKKNNIKFFLILILVCIISFIFINSRQPQLIENVVQRFERVQVGDSNIKERDIYKSEYIKNFSEGNILQQLLGRGFGGGVNASIRRPHNIYVLILNQVGIIGLIIFFIINITIFIKFKKMRSIIGYILIVAYFEPVLLTMWVDYIIILMIILEINETKYLKEFRNITH